MNLERRDVFFGKVGGFRALPRIAASFRFESKRRTSDPTTLKVGLIPVLPGTLAANNRPAPVSDESYSRLFARAVLLFATATCAEQHRQGQISLS